MSSEQVKQIVAQMGGAIGANSGLGGTLKFDFGEPGSVYIDGKSTPNTVGDGEGKTADCTISLTLDTFEKMVKRVKAYKVGDGVMQPRVLSKVDPEYTQEAKGAQIQGTVMLQAVVTAEGTADNITVVNSLDPGLDEKAIEAISKWTFQPGTKDGSPVPVWVTIEVHFRLK